MSYGLESLETRQLEGILTILNQCCDSFLFEFDLSKDTFFISNSARNIFNFPEEKMENATQALMKIVYGEDQASLRADLDLLKTGKKTEHNLDYRWINKNGKPVWIRSRGRILPNENDAKRILIGEVSIVTDEDKTDLLTGLATESQLRIDFGSVWTKKQCVSGFILKIDIDNLGTINEQYGVTTGDIIV